MLPTSFVALTPPSAKSNLSQIVNLGCLHLFRFGLFDADSVPEGLIRWVQPPDLSDILRKRVLHNRLWCFCAIISEKSRLSVFTSTLPRSLILNISLAMVPKVGIITNVSGNGTDNMKEDQ